MIDRYIALSGRLLFLAFVLWSVQLSGAAQAPPQGDDPGRLQNMTFKEANVKTVLGVLGRQLDLEVTFDESFPDLLVTIEMADVTVKQTMEAIIKMKKLNVKMKDDETLLIFEDTPENNQKYGDLAPWTARQGS